MNYLNSILNNLKHNKLLKLTVRKVISKSTRDKIWVYRNKDRAMRLYFENSTTRIDMKNQKLQGIIPVYYADAKPNFGDFIGPYLISKITGKPVINIKDLEYPGIMAVGSIIQMIDRKNIVIWGSGLIATPTEDLKKSLKDYEPRILSVRGNVTAKYLAEANLQVPDEKFYGDPALSLPLFYTPTVTGPKKIGICPHYIHKQHFIKSIHDLDNYSLIDVEKEEIEGVVDEIASASVCISSSLHGLIIAQAYNIPWVWLEVYDNALIGQDFKFKDFFSTINESQVTHVKVKMEEIKDIDFDSIATRATLPEKLYNEELIVKAIESYLDIK